MCTGVKASGILKNCVQHGRKLSVLLLWWSAWGLCEKFSADELWQDLDYSELTFPVKNTSSSFSLQSIELSSIFSVFHKAGPEENLILWIWSFLALSWFYDILAVHICSKFISTYHGNFLFRKILRWLWATLLLMSSISTPWSYYNSWIITISKFLNSTNTNW